MKFRLSSPTYLNMKGDIPGVSSPTFLEEGTIIGEGTPYDFEGTPNQAMVPLDDAAQQAWDDAHNGYTGGAPTVKGTSAPPEGGATPFDPASGATNSETDADKAAADQKAKDDKAAEDKKKADAAAAASKK